jgi:hypothetical protein
MTAPPHERRVYRPGHLPAPAHAPARAGSRPVASARASAGRPPARAGGRSPAGLPGPAGEGEVIEREYSRPNTADLCWLSSGSA